MRRGPGVVAGAFIGIMVGLAPHLTNLIFRQFGLSTYGRASVVRKRTEVFAEGHRDESKSVEVYVSREWTILILVVSPLMALFCGAAGWKLTEPAMKYTAWGFAAFSIWATLYAISSFYWPLARANADGVLGYEWGIRGAISKFVPWSDIASCEIETFTDFHSGASLSRPILRNRDGSTLLRLDLRYTRPKDQEALVRYIQERLPKTVLDPWDAEAVS